MPDTALYRFRPLPGFRVGRVQGLFGFGACRFLSWEVWGFSFLRWGFILIVCKRASDRVPKS